VKVALHSLHHSLTLSKQRSWIHDLTGQYLRCVRSETFLPSIQRTYQIFCRLWHRRWAWGRYGGEDKYIKVFGAEV